MNILLKTLDKNIHEPARLQIMAYLYTKKTCDATLLKIKNGLSWGNFSVHLSKLEKAGYVKTIKHFFNNKPKTTYQITSKGKKSFKNYKKQIKKFLK